MTENELRSLMAPHRGCRISEIEYVSEIKTAATHKAKTVEKLVRASIRLYTALSPTTDPYLAALEREGVDLSKWKDGSVWYDHSDDVFSIARHKANRTAYLWGMWQAVHSVRYFIDGVEATKGEVLALLTPSGVKEFTSDGTTYNATNDITHHAKPRVVKLAGVRWVR